MKHKYNSYNNMTQKNYNNHINLLKMMIMLKYILKKYLEHIKILKKV